MSSCVLAGLLGRVTVKKSLIVRQQRTMRVIGGDTNTQKLKNLLGIGEQHDKESSISMSDNDYSEPFNAELDYISASQGHSEPRENPVSATLTIDCVNCSYQTDN